MKPCVKRWSAIPYGGQWKFTYPPTGHVVTGRNYDALMSEAKKYFQANNIPIGLEFEAQIEDYVCASMPDACVPCDDGRPIRVTKRLGMMDVARGTRTMLSHWWNGRQLVDDAEAKRRADICRGCNLYNVPFSRPCGGLCGDLATVMNSFTGVVNHSYEEGLNSCAVCGCMLSAAIWVPLSVQCGPLSQEMKDAFAKIPWCWKTCK